MLHYNNNKNANLNVLVITNYIKVKADEDQPHCEYEVCRDRPGNFSISHCLKSLSYILECM